MKKMMILLAACALLLSGCTESHIVSGNAPDYSDLPQPVGGVVWEQLWTDFDEIYTDQELYPFSETVSAQIDDEKHRIQFFLLLNTEISQKAAAEYATTVIKGLNDLIAEQNPNYTNSTDTSYGSFVEGYEVYVIVAPDAAKDDKTTWILEDTIPAGEYRAVLGAK
ncbi:MAG: hypothetical protein RR593_07145 [Hungatella sp.]